MLEQSRILRSPAKDGDEGDAAAPLGKLEHIPNPDADIQMIGHYLLSEKRSLQQDIESTRAQKTEAETNPIDVELDTEQDAERNGLRREDVRKVKDWALDTERMQSLIDDLSNRASLIENLLRELGQNNYRGCLAFLQKELDAKNFADEFMSVHNPKKQVGTALSREKRGAEKRALGEYISILQKKLK